MRSAVQSRASHGDSRDCLGAHNILRRHHGVPDLVWDERIAAYAQKRSEYIAARGMGSFEHPKDGCLGENLYAQSWASWGCAPMVRSWYDEIKSYDFGKPGFSPDTGHFTALVWRTTTRVGCGMARGAPGTWGAGGVYLTCNYWLFPNIIGAFEENVPPPLGGVLPPPSG